jgi:hypothetical protein
MKEEHNDIVETLQEQKEFLIKVKNIKETKTINKIKKKLFFNELPKIDTKEKPTQFSTKK